MKIIVTTYVFGILNKEPFNLLESHGFKAKTNELGRKYSREELIHVLKKEQPDVIIAGTEKYDEELLDLIPNLKMISRVGAGLDSVDLKECKKRNIIVTSTPDAPSNAVAELTICQIINMLRRIKNAQNDLLQGRWNRIIGKEIKECYMGIIGLGRIGGLVYKKLKSFDPKSIWINDIDKSKYKNIDQKSIKSKREIFSKCDVITIHIPYNEKNKDYVSIKEFKILKSNACLVNTSRGGIIDEEALYHWLKENKEASAAVDAFQKEPYKGKLLKCNNAYLTPHLGSCSDRSRLAMEGGAAKEVVRYLLKKKFGNRVI